jgi:hypothetical protein
MIVHELAIVVGAIHELPLPRLLDTDIIKNMTQSSNRSAQPIQSKGYNYSVDRAYSLTNIVTQTSTS